MILLSTVVLSVTGVIAASPTYAATTITLTLNPPNPIANSNLEFRGTITPSAGSSQEIAVNLYRNSGCNVSQYLQMPIEGYSDSSGSSYSIIVRLGIAYLSYIGPGTYSAYARISNTPNIASSCVNFTISAPVPEFPVGVPTLAVFVLIVCVIMTRKSSRKELAGL